MEQVKIDYNIDKIREEGIENWIHCYLNNEGDNEGFSQGLKLVKRYYSDIVEFDLGKLQRCCGPEEDMQYKIDPEYFNYYVNNMVNSINEGWSAPPLIVNLEDGKLTVNDGNHRLEALRRVGIKRFWVIFWTTDKEDFVRLPSLL